MKLYDIENYITDNEREFMVESFQVNESIADERSMKFVERTHQSLNEWEDMIREMSPQELKDAAFELQSAIDGINYNTKTYHIPGLENKYWDEKKQRRELFRRYLNRLKRVRLEMELEDPIEYDDFGDEIKKYPDYEPDRDQDLQFEGVVKEEAKKREVGELLLDWDGGYFENEETGENEYDDFAWDDLTDELTYILRRKNKSGDWYAKVSGFGWRGMDGEQRIEGVADTGQKFLNKILPDTDCHFKIYDYGKNGLAINNFHHDSPTGAEWYYIVPFRYKKELQESLELENKFMNEYKKLKAQKLKLIHSLPITKEKEEEIKRLRYEIAKLKSWLQQKGLLDDGGPSYEPPGGNFNENKSLQEAKFSKKERWAAKIKNVPKAIKKAEKKLIDQEARHKEEGYDTEEINDTPEGEQEASWSRMDIEHTKRNLHTMRKLKKEDIDKYATPEEKKFLKEWAGQKVMDWKAYAAKLKDKSIEELQYMAKDAHEAALAGDDLAKAGLPNNGGYYWDEVHMITDEIRRRKAQKDNNNVLQTFHRTHPK
jgi:hypothetical protein